MSARWYKRCGADFIHGTMMLTLEEKGAYSLCLDLIYDRGGPIPDDARWLAGVCGVSLRKWSAIRDRLISLGKIISDGDHLSNSRADFELVSSELHARKLAESGAKGGRKRAENAGQAKENNDLAQAPLKLTREDKIRLEETAKAVVISVEMPLAPEVEDLGIKPEHVIEAWNMTAKPLGLQLVRKFTPERRRKLNTFIRRHSIDEITEGFAAIPRSPFLRGENARGWRADFDWVLEPKNFTKLQEGTYER